jgi:hypothetical protein
VHARHTLYHIIAYNPENFSPYPAQALGLGMDNIPAEMKAKSVLPGE